MADTARTIGGYALEQKLRTGPHLAVFESHDKLGRRVEVACYRAGALLNRTGKEAFLTEARRTASLHHENLCLMVDAGEEEGIWYAISVAPNAPSLRELLDRGGALDGDRMAVVAAGALAGLSYLAREELRHADLRPETVFLRGGRVLLAPRPLVPYAPRERDARYLSPEEIRAQGSDVRSDLFSLGLVLMEGLTGTPALAGESPEESLEALRTRPPEPPPGAPPGLAALIRSVLAERPEDRPSDPGAGLRMLRGEVFPAVTAAPGSAPPAPAAVQPLAPASAVPTAAVAPAAVAAAPRLPPGVLNLPSGDKRAVWELSTEPTYLVQEGDSVTAAATAAEGTLGRIERGGGGDVFIVDETADPRPRVNGSLVDRHPLAPGDRIRVGAGEIEYSAPRPEPRKTTPVPRRTAGSPVLILLSVGLCLLTIGFGVVQGLRAMSDGDDVLVAAGEAEIRLAEAEGRPASAPGTSAGDREKARQLFEAAQDFATKNPADTTGIVTRFREIASFYGGTDYGWFAQQKLVEIDSALKESLAREWDALGQEVGRRIEEDQLYDAHLLYLNFGRDHPDTLFADRAGREAENMLEAIRSRFADDLQRVEEALRVREYGVALDHLLAIERYGTPDQRREAAERKDEVRAKIQETQVPGEESPPEEPPVEPPPAEPPPVEPPPAEPEDGPNEEKAAKLFERATTLFERKRMDEVLETLADLAALGETRVATEHAGEIERMRGLARLEVESFAVLFKGSPQVIRGREVELTYRFDSEDEMKDWIYLNPFADVRPGSFFFTEEGIRGRGVGAALHPAEFEPGTLTMRARVKPIGEAKDLGFQMLEPEGLIRFYLFTVQNRFFTIGAERAKAHENMIWIFGEGAWADTPNAELGFVRVAGSEEPKPISGEWFDLAAAKAGDRVTMSIMGKKLTGSALGDDRFEYPALQPALYVLGAEAIFDEVVIRGTLDSKWAEDKMARLRRVFDR